MINILGKRYLFFLISLLVIVPGMVVLGIWKFPLAIDFTGGSLLEVKFEEGKTPQPASIVQLYQGLGIVDVQVQTTSEGTLVARSVFLDETARSKVIAAMENTFSSKVTVFRFDSVGPTIGKEVGARASVAVGVAALAVIFISLWRLEVYSMRCDMDYAQSLL